MKRSVWGWMVLGVALAGSAFAQSTLGPGPELARQYRTALPHYDKAVRAFSRKDYVSARRELDAAIESARQDEDVRAIVVRSASEKFFSAGADVSVFAKSDFDTQNAFVVCANDAMSKFESTPKVVIAAINGHCLGGGLEIALCCDLLVAARTAVFGIPEVKRGLAAVREASTMEADEWTRAEAEFALWDMNVREKNFNDATVIAQRLGRQFPENREVAKYLATRVP